MIAVIADDFTGAAEIGGLALSYGYSSVIITNFLNVPESDIVIFASNMRSLSSSDAALESRRITRGLLKLNPTLIYKKIDSVLRGNIGAELAEQMEVSGMKRALLIPANPILERTIKNCIYYIGDKPLMESFFAKDNSFKTESSNVVEILRKEGSRNIHCISLDETLPKDGLIVGNTQSNNDLDCWVERIDNHTTLAGASGFFGAIIAQNSSKKNSYNTDEIQGNRKSLFICGSNFPLSKKAVTEVSDKDVCVSAMPDEIYYSKTINNAFVEKWIFEVVSMFKTCRKVIVSVLQKPNEKSIASEDIKLVLGHVVSRVMEQVDIKELFVEGGSTAESIVKKLKLNAFVPYQAFTPGVTRMKLDNKKEVFLTMKPGSYSWPKSIWKFNN